MGMKKLAMIVWLAAGLVACGGGDAEGRGGSGGSGAAGGSGGSGGSGGAGGSGGSEPGACEWPVDPFPEDLGSACTAGSNLALCLMDSTEACESSLCLWDANDPAEGKAYCTVACDAADETSCPAGFSCQLDGCEETAVCVRTSLPTIDRLVVRDDAVPQLGSADWHTRTTDGSTWWMNYDSDRVYQRRPDGSWTSFSIPTTAPRSGMIGVGTDLFVLANVLDEWASPLHGRLYRLRDGSVESGDLEDRVHTWFVDGDGRLTLSGGATREAVVQEDLTVERLPDRTTGTQACVVRGPLGERGFYGTCSGETVVGPDVDGFVVLPGVDVSSLAGLGWDDVFGFAGDELVHFDGSELRTEAGPPPHDFGRVIVPTGPGAAVVLAYDGYVAASAEGCWQPVIDERSMASLPWDDEKVVAIDGSHVGWVQSGRFYELDVTAE